MQTLGAPAFECGPGLKRFCGSFTTNSAGTTILNQRPSKNEVTITRKAQGVYLVVLNQPSLSVVMADAWLGYASAIVGAGSVSLGTTVMGTVNCSADYMSSDGTHYSADTTNTSFLILVYAAASNPTSLTLTDVYGLGNTSGVANFRVCYEFQVATSTMNQ